jgi:hypothetical protein
MLGEVGRKENKGMVLFLRNISINYFKFSKIVKALAGFL